MFSQLVFLYIFQITVVACKAVGSFYVPRKLRPWGHHLFTSFTPVLDVLLQAANKMNFLLVLVQGEQIHTHTVTALQVALVIHVLNQRLGKQAGGVPNSHPAGGTIPPA